ncbi:MAG: YbaB/EbfC family nucleoid-associated protein [Coriobacteriales bacterium]|jgi:DNA-binding YbaB/EbfC family protein|nr:YbaB/EbfC family nucleoid-associated protein [Coriobacteriales bacterium]
MDMNQMMRQARKMQADLARVQEEVNQLTCEATVGGGAVKVVAGGDLEIKSITIAPEAVDPQDVEMLQDLVTAAVNEAIRSAQELAAARMSAVTGGMNLPGF